MSLTRLSGILRRLEYRTFHIEWKYPSNGGFGPFNRDMDTIIRLSDLVREELDSVAD